MSIHNNKGSIMLETVLVLPILVLIIFFLIQITFVWTAKQMTYYAAYCGARAALVYNPMDYGAEQQDDGSWELTTGNGGVVHQAACTVLSWISWSLGGYDLTAGSSRQYLEYAEMNEILNFRIGSYSVPLSSNIKNQVRVKIKEYEKIESEETEQQNRQEENEEHAKIYEQFPAVTVSVTFKCPLFIPLGGPIIAYFFGANDNICFNTDNAISVGGFSAPYGNEIHSNLVNRGNYTQTSYMDYYSIPLTETCTMAKPYKTDTFPLMPEEDKRAMGILE